MNMITTLQPLPTKSKIITITPNPAVDYFITVNGLSAGANIVAESNIKFAAGKGINVAKGIEALGGGVHALGFVGAQSLPVFKSLQSEQLYTDFIVVDGETRHNITLFDTRTGIETHIRTTGASITASACHLLTEKLDLLLNRNDIMVLSGSLAAGISTDWYAKLINLGHRKAARVFLDTNGDALRPALSARPDLIKPNQAEFEQLIGKPMREEQAIIGAARELIATGIKSVIVSQAERGALFIERDQAFKAWVNTSDFGHPVTHIGCGDAMLAGLAFAKLYRFNLRQTLKTAVACGTANLFSVEPGKFDKQCFTRIYPHVHIKLL